MEPITADKIGRYEIKNLIGYGGFAIVYMGRDPYINRSVALKVSELGDESRQQRVLERLFKEAEAAGALLHPNIVTIYDVGIQEPYCYIAMEFIQGTTLHHFCQPGNTLPLADAVDVMIKVLHGLDFAHQRGVIHRDVKPSNILLGANGEIKITDFGLACFADLASLDRRTVGTPSYMPPEQVEGRGSTPQSDLFSAGVILYQLLCGRKPFEAPTSEEVRAKIVAEPHTPLSERNSELPPEFTIITDRALSKVAADRYRTGFEFARDIEAVLRGSKRPIDGQLGERIKSLKTLRFFEGFSDEEIAQILNIGTWLTCKEGETVIREDEQGNAFFVIAAGEAAAILGDKIIGHMSRGECFGEMAFLLGRKRSATIKAMKECNLLRLNPEKIDILPMEMQAKLYRLFAKTLAAYLLKADQKT